MEFQRGESVWSTRCWLLGEDEKSEQRNASRLSPERYCDFGSLWLKTLYEVDKSEKKNLAPSSLALRALQVLDTVNLAEGQWKADTSSPETKGEHKSPDQVDAWTSWMHKIDWVSDEVKYLSSSLDVWTTPGATLTLNTAWKTVCQAGHVELAYWFATYFKGHLEVYPCSLDLFFQVLNNGHMAMAQWLYPQMDTEESRFEVCSLSNFKGDVELVKWAVSLLPTFEEERSRRHYWLRQTVQNILKGVPNLRILEFCAEWFQNAKTGLFDFCMRLDMRPFVVSASEQGNVEALEWAFTMMRLRPNQYGPISNETIYELFLKVCSTGNMKVAQLLKNWIARSEKPDPLNGLTHPTRSRSKRLFQSVMETGQVDRLEWWYQEVDPEMSWDIPLSSYFQETQHHKKILRWVVAQGQRWPFWHNYIPFVKQLPQRVQEHPPSQEVLNRIHTMMEEEPGAQILHQKAFEIACVRGDLEIAIWIHRHWPEGHSYDQVLFSTCVRGCEIKVVKWLEEKFDIVHDTKRLYDTLIAVSENPNLEMVKWFWDFVSRKERIMSITRSKAVYHACKYGRIHVAQWITEQKELYQPDSTFNFTEMAMKAWQTTIQQSRVHTRSDMMPPGASRKNVLAVIRETLEWIFYHPNHEEFRTMVTMNFAKFDQVSPTLLVMGDGSILDWFCELCPSWETHINHESFLVRALRHLNFETAFWLMKRKPSLITSRPLKLGNLMASPPPSPKAIIFWRKNHPIYQRDEPDEYDENDEPEYDDEDDEYDDVHDLSSESESESELCCPLYTTLFRTENRRKKTKEPKGWKWVMENFENSEKYPRNSAACHRWLTEVTKAGQTGKTPPPPPQELIDLFVYENDEYLPHTYTFVL